MPYLVFSTDCPVSQLNQLRQKRYLQNVEFQFEEVGSGCYRATVTVAYYTSRPQTQTFTATGGGKKYAKAKVALTAMHALQCAVLSEPSDEEPQFRNDLLESGSESEYESSLSTSVASSTSVEGNEQPKCQEKAETVTDSVIDLMTFDEDD